VSHAREASSRSKVVATAARRPWLTALVLALAVAWGVAHAEPCSIKTRGDGCAVRLPLDQTWSGGLLWGGAAFAAAWLALLVVRRLRSSGTG
jgi:hypothetical protein